MALCHFKFFKISFRISFKSFLKRWMATILFLQKYRRLLKSQHFLSLFYNIFPFKICRKRIKIVCLLNKTTKQKRIPPFCCLNFGNAFLIFEQAVVAECRKNKRNFWKIWKVRKKIYLNLRTLKRKICKFLFLFLKLRLRVFLPFHRK